MEVRKLTKEVRKTICMFLTASMVFTNTSLTTFATEESVQTKEVLTEQALTEEVLQEETETAFTQEGEITEAEHDNTEKSDIVKENNIVDESSVLEENIPTEEINVMNESDMVEENASAEELYAVGESNAAEESGDFIASGAYEDITWVIDKDGNLTIEGTGEFAAVENTSVSRAPWSDYYESIKTATVNVQGLTDASYMFYLCRYLTDLDVSGFNTENVTNMKSMFSWCSNLTDLDVSGFNTENVTNMASMFSWCDSLTNLDVSGFRTENVVNMQSMFRNCKKLNNLDVSNFNTENVTNMGGMFCDCQNLRNLDVSNFNTENVTNMNSMFSECGCSLDVSNFNTENVTNMGSMFFGYSYLNLNVSSFNTENVTNMDSMFKNCKVERLNINNFNIEKITSMREMFSGCKNLTHLYIDRLNTENITDMSNMFSGCSALTYLPVRNLNTKNVTTMECMFSGCSRLTSLGVSGFNTENVTTMECMFKDCSGLTSLDVSGFNTENVTTMAWMFSGCSGLTSLDVSSFNLKNVTTMAMIFENCSGLKSLDVSRLDTKNVTDMEFMFSGCSALTELDLHHFQTENASMLCMFTDCRSLKTLDLSSFDIEEGGTSLKGCINLRTLYTPFRTSGIIEYDLPDGGTWYDKAGNTYTKLPQSSILLTKYSIPSAVTPHVMAMKTNTVYEYGSVVNMDDLRVKYYAADGTVRWVEPSEYTTNADEINTLQPGEQILSVAYDGLMAEVALTILEREESSTMPESDTAEESSTTPESSTTEESSNTQESSTMPESDTAEESSTMPESSTTEESSTTSESDTTEESVPEDQDDSPYEDNERIDLKSVNSTIANIKVKVYDGNAYEPVIKVTAVIGGKRTVLKEGADYRVLYQHNINAGTGTVIVRGNGIYKGEITKTFTISQKSVKKLKVITGSIIGAGSLDSLPVYVYDGTKLLQPDIDYTLSNYKAIKRTSAQVTINAVKNSNYTGSTIVKFTVYENSAGSAVKLINPDDVTLVEDVWEYTGKAVTPKVTVSVNGKPLTNKDYKIQYQNNKNAGTGFVIITGKGEYKGKVALPFTINAETVAADAITIKPVPAKTYNGKLHKPAVTVTIQKNGKAKKLAKNKDYTVAYENNFHAGEATIIVTGKGNYEGLSATAKFVIHSQNIKKASLKGTQDKLVLMYNKRTLREGTDYEKPVYGTAIANKVEVTIKGKGDFTGVMTKKIKTN